MPDVGTGIGAAASIGGSIIGGKSAKDAAKTQANAVDAASAAQERMFQQNRSDLAPWRSAGVNALGELERLLYDPATTARNVQGQIDAANNRYNALQAEYRSLWNYRSSPQRDSKIAQLEQEMRDLAGQISQNTTRLQANAQSAGDKQSGSLLRDFSLSDFQADPSYEFRRSEGMRGIERSGAARGMQLSGATLRALNRYNSDLASQEYGAAFARDAANKERKFNMLSGVAGTGQTATNTTAALGAGAASNMASLMTDRGNALAAGQVGAANAWSGGISDAIGQAQQSLLLDRLFPRTSIGGGSSGGGSSGSGVAFMNPSAIGGANSLYVPRIA